MKELNLNSRSGIPTLLAIVGSLIVALAVVVTGPPLFKIVGVIAIAVLLFCAAGLYMVEPNQAAVLTLFGRYVGTVKEAGLRWNNPFFAKKKLSLRVRNFESGRLKVNELEGSPIEIAAVIVWRVVDSAESVFNIDDYESFLQVQSESALRAMATHYPYDSHDDGSISLRSHQTEISQHLKDQLDERLTTAGVDVVDARISHLAYAPEIAQAMLQRQQAGAVIAARTRIVEGAVGMVEMALDQLKSKGVVDLDNERRAAMVSNLLVVLCSERSAQPVINAGSLY